MAEKEDVGTPDTLPGEIVTIVLGYLKESDDAETTKKRHELTKRNLDLLSGEQDWSNKAEGQSTEVVPKVATAVEQFSAFVKRGLIQFGDWFAINNPSVLNSDKARDLLKYFLGDRFAVTISDAVKQALLESLLVFKVYGGKGEETPDGFSPWTLKIDLIRTEDYHPDPTGRGLYEIHTSYRDLHEVLDQTDLYDEVALKDLKGSYDVKSKNRRPEKEASYRKLVRLDECWGTLIKPNGEVVAKNIVCTIANKKYLIRKPEPNPFWHRSSPFVVAPLLRVPNSVWHRALYDDAAAINIAFNEMFNLTLDGGIAAVWGIRQLRLAALDDPSQVDGGIPQGETLLIKEDWPANIPALDILRSGGLPSESLLIMQVLEKHFNEAALTSELAKGMMPAKDVKAAEVQEASMSQAITLDSVIFDLENEAIRPLLKKAWMTVLQHVHMASGRNVAQTIGMNDAVRLALMPKETLYTELGQKPDFQVNGLSSLISRARDLQRVLMVIQVLFGNPLFAQIFVKKYDPVKLVDLIIKLANVKIDQIERQEAPGGPGGNPMEALKRMMGGMGGQPGAGVSVPRGPMPPSEAQDFTA